MTLPEFYEYLLLGGAQNEFGFQIGPGTLDYLTQHPDGTVYMFVNLYHMSDGTVVSLCVNALGKTIPFERVSHFMSSANMKLDDRTDEEFLEAFTELMS